MILRPTKIEDISRVIDIINQAKTYFKNNDIDQWQDGYPNEETIEKDIENNEAYVLEEDGVILGTCMVTIHGEPAYNRIEGKWILNCHRRKFWYWARLRKDFCNGRRQGCCCGTPAGQAGSTEGRSRGRRRSRLHPASSDGRARSKAD